MEIGLVGKLGVVSSIVDDVVTLFYFWLRADAMVIYWLPLNSYDTISLQILLHILV
jgi:hypothetical protein